METCLEEEGWGVEADVAEVAEDADVDVADIEVDTVAVAVAEVDIAQGMLREEWRGWRGGGVVGQPLLLLPPRQHDHALSCIHRHLQHLQHLLLLAPSPPPDVPSAQHIAVSHLAQSLHLRSQTAYPKEGQRKCVPHTQND